MTEPSEDSETRDELRARIVEAATALLTSGGREALTTRAVAALAGVQAPTLYRLFGDKSGLLEAVAEHGFARYLSHKVVKKPSKDPVVDLRVGWDLHIGFGLENPAVYSIMYGEPRPGVTSPAAAAAWQILKQHIHRIAASGQLRVSEARAAELVHAAACGTVFSLLAVPAEQRDVGLSRAAREAVIAAITTGARAAVTSTVATSAIALRAGLSAATMLSSAERKLLAEWLERIAQGS